VQRLRRSWADAALIGVATGLGIAAEAHSYAWGQLDAWIPDLLTGWLLVACGLAARGRPGLLLAASGLAWFAGNFTPAALLLHRGPLAQAVLTYPAGRASRRLDRSAVAIAYLVSIAGSIWWADPSTFGLAAFLLVAAGMRYLSGAGVRRRERGYALRAAGFFALVLAADAAANVIRNTASERTVLLHVYQAGLVALAGGLLYGLVRRPWQHTGVVDLVVDLGEARAGSVREALAQALGDGTLDVAYRVGGGYIDAAGRTVDLPRASSGRSLTPIERDGAEVAVLVHHAAVLEDPTLLEAVATATRLAAANARLQAEVRQQVAELEASRRRVVEAGDAERRRLERSLREGALRRLAHLDTRLEIARATASTAAAQIGDAQAQLERVSSELRELAAGLHPRELLEHGLGSALAALAERSPVPVELTLSPERAPAAVELTLFFVCSEALANAWKHAHASAISVTVEQGVTTARIDVRDDGVGGAAPRSLADRIEAVGGTLSVRSPPGGGTRVLAEIPLT
jgi:signal transduction histidine kinase